MNIDAETKLIGRRNFIKAATILPVAGTIALKASDVGPVKTGIVGTGMEGRILITQTDPRYLYLTASCDIRPDNRAIGNAMVRDPKLGHNPKAKAYTKFEDMLNDADIEAVIVATPLHTHASLAIQALKAGKHVFVEKTMAYTLEECMEMIRLAKERNLNLQIGHQRFYNPLYWDAFNMVKEGLLGNVYHIRAGWHRNTDWNYWTFINNKATADQQQQLLKMDTKEFGYQDVQHLVNWRWYKEMSHGLWTELCSHQIAITNWFFDAMPTAVYASGGKYKSDVDQDLLYMKHKTEYGTLLKYHDTTAKTFDEYLAMKKGYSKDDRTITDHIYAIFEYPKNRTVTYSAIQSNSQDNYYEEIMGTRGTILLCNENENYLFWEPGWDEEKAKKAAESEKPTQIDLVSETAESAFAAHVSAEAKGGGGASGMAPYDPYRYELQGFAHTIRSGFPNMSNGKRGAMAAAACLYAEKSMETKTRLVIPALNL